ncbi:MAG: UDP-N-acetylmuramate--L-alanine ligase [Bacteroidota bacterium]
MNVRDYDIVFFIGVGGIGMSALARWFNANGFEVYGYDRTETPLTQELVKEGISVHYDDDISLIPNRLYEGNGLVIITPAIPKSHKQMNDLKKRGFEMYKRSQILGMISDQFTTVAVAGTHGKTTTSSMIAHLLKFTGLDVTAFLGGIATNYNTNFIANQGTSNAIAVVEADEFDRSFLTLHPDVAIITSTDADHLDIYGNRDTLRDSFKDFINQVKSNGKLLVTEVVAGDLELINTKIQYSTYGLNRGQFFASNITIEDGFFVFNYCDEQYNIDKVKLGVPGFYNVENAVVAIATALTLGASPEKVKAGMESYQGVKRRFEYIVRSQEIVFVDDYAHHPTEIEAFLKSLKAMYPERKITAIFQPHLYTRTRDFMEGFAESLDLADEVILLDIYPAREEPIPGITSEVIFEKLKVSAKVITNKEKLAGVLETKELEVVTTIGAGDIDQLVKPIKEQLERRYHVG